MLEIPRQWRHPREFRIARPATPEEWAAALLRAVARSEPVPPPDDQPVNPAPAGTLAQPAVAELATGLWRLRRRLSGPAPSPGARDGGGAADLHRARRQFESLWSTLAAAGVEIQEHDHTRYDSGLDLQVLEFQQTEGLTDEIVLETLRPSVYLHGLRVQTGEVVVGVPVTRDEDG